MNSSYGIPTEKWSLTRLGQFCAKRHQRLAIDVWLVGKAMTLAKDRCRNEKESFTQWKKQHSFSNATTSRYMRIYRLHESDEAFEKLKTIGILQAFTDAGFESSREHVPRQPAAKRSAAVQEKPSVTNNGTPSWAVPDNDGEAVSKDGTSQAIEVWSKRQCLEKELQEVVPQQIQVIKDTVTDVLQYDAELLRAALPKNKSARRKIATDIDALVELLSRLATTFRDEPEPGAAVRKKRRKVA